MRIQIIVVRGRLSIAWRAGAGQPLQCPTRVIDKVVGERVILQFIIGSMDILASEMVFEMSQKMPRCLCERFGRQGIFQNSLSTCRSTSRSSLETISVIGEFGSRQAGHRWILGCELRFSYTRQARPSPREGSEQIRRACFGIVPAKRFAGLQGVSDVAWNHGDIRATGMRLRGD